ncbi:M48 family metalloprotease [Roseicella aerolata]|uniref:M48 family metalloprotease n=1 Tax=Roseicella aerolata TaxID=2883479 RepID=A0A9X1LAG9_9PROT|nr:M48 family metalloprotease [Roseicella aerolata]MCB4824814.1 M48 family metalloprotease [Roseicella aerolata]
MAFRLDPAALARQRRLNRLHSALLLLSLSGLAGWTGLLVGGPEGLAFGAGLVLAFLLLSPMPGDALFRHAFGAVRLSPTQAPDLLALLAALARRAGLPRPPALYLIPSPMLQAMAAGSREAPVIAVTLGLLRSLPPRELAAVLAHEVAHIRHGDLRVLRLATAAATLTRAMAGIGALLLLVLLPALWASGMAPSPLALLLLMAAPILSDLLTLSLSRRREFLADAGAVELTGDVEALAEALARLWRLQGDDWERLASRAPRWLRWFRTHPTVRDRIAALRGMATPVRAPWPEADLIAITPGALPWSLGGHHPAQRLARRWLL